MNNDHQPLTQDEWNQWHKFFAAIHLLAKDSRHQSMRASDNSYSFLAQRNFGLWMLVYHPPAWTSIDRAYLRWDRSPNQFDDPTMPLQLVWSFNDDAVVKLSVAISNPAADKEAHFNWNGAVLDGEEVLLELDDCGPWNAFLRQELVRMNERLERGISWHEAVVKQEQTEAHQLAKQEREKQLARAQAEWKEQEQIRSRQLAVAAKLFETGER